MLPIKGRLPVPLADTIIGSDSRLRHPAVQAEIECRVGIYADQVEQYGRIGRKWLPKRGSGKSALARVCAAGPCERERVLGEAYKSQPLGGNTSGGN